MNFSVELGVQGVKLCTLQKNDLVLITKKNIEDYIPAFKIIKSLYKLTTFMILN